MFAPVVAISIVPLMLTGGASLDLAMATKMKAKLQSALDAAVVAGAMVDGNGASVATSVFEANFQASNETGSPNLSFSYEGANVFAGTARLEVPTMVIKYAGMHTLAIEALSKAAFNDDGLPTCIHVMDVPGAPAKFEIGANVTLDLKECRVVIDTDDPHAIDIHPTADIEVPEICSTTPPAVGSAPPGVAISQCEEGAGIEFDIGNPDRPCDFTNFTLDDDDTSVLNPGVYCGNTTISDEETNVYLNPGVYVVRNGRFRVRGTRLHSRPGGVTFVLIGPNAELDLNPNTDLLLMPSSTGPTKDILIYADESAADAPITLKVGSWFWATGIIYAPQNPLTIKYDGVHPMWPKERVGNIPNYTVVSNEFILAPSAQHTQKPAPSLEIPTSDTAILIQ